MERRRLGDSDPRDQAALAWVVAQPDVTAAVAGPRRPEHFDAVREALATPLSADEADALARLFKVSH
jgi:aryl-alcohol dehydrogenase-like predicted oxidoreductase